MLHMLDTDIASYIIKDDGGNLFRDKLAVIDPRDICISALTRAELLFGLKSLPPRHRLHLGVRRFLHSVQVLSWAPDGAEFYAEIRHELKRTGNLIGEMDMLIAAHALSADAALVTNNTRHFKRIKQPLMLINWME